MDCEDCRIDLDVIEPSTCGHTGTLFWCLIHGRYECATCRMEDERKALNGEEQ
jgi:hypothetical protein